MTRKRPCDFRKMDDHGLPTSFGGEAMAMSAEYSTEDGEEEDGYKVQHCSSSTRTVEIRDKMGCNLPILFQPCTLFDYSWKDV
jgi:hypothetical protein